MTANGTTHTTEEATVYVHDLDMFVEFRLLIESPAVLSLGTLCEENGHSYEWHPGQPSFIIKNCGTANVKQTTTFTLVVPVMQTTDHQTQALGGQKHTRAVGDHKLHVLTDLPEWLQPFTEGLTRGSSSSTDVSPDDVDIPPPALPLSAHPPAKPTSNRARRKHHLFIHFPKDPNCEVCRRTKVTRAPCRKNPYNRADNITIAERFDDGRTPYERRFKSPFDGADHSFRSRNKNRPYICKRPGGGVHQFGEKVLLGNSRDTS